MNAPAQLALPVRLRDHATFDTFDATAQPLLIAELRVAAARPHGRQPAWLWGPPGSGRSHLLQAVCAAASEAGHTAAYLPLEQLAALDPGLLEGQERAAVIALDDVDQEVTLARRWREAVFALYNSVRDAGGWLVFTTATAPSGFRSGLPDLDSRLAAAAVHRLTPLDESGLRRALAARAGRLGLELPEETARWLLARAPRDAASLFALLDRLDVAALQAQRRLTVPFVRAVLSAAPGEPGAAVAGAGVEGERRDSGGAGS